MQSLWMLLASVMFACMGASIKYVLEHGATLSSVVLFRSFPPVLCILAWALLTHHSIKTPYPLPHLKRNVSGVTSMWLSFKALGVLPLATSTSLNYLSALFIGLYVVFSARNFRRDWVKLLVVLFGFAGVLLVLRPSINENQWVGVLAGGGAGLLAAFAMMQIRSLGRLGEPVWRTVFYFSLVGSLSGLVAMHPSDYADLPIQTWIVLVLTGLFGMFGQLALTQAYGAGSPIIVAVLQYSTIIFSAVLGILFWHNIPDMTAWLGMFMVIFAGVSIVVVDQKTALSEKMHHLLHKKH